MKKGKKESKKKGGGGGDKERKREKKGGGGGGGREKRKDRKKEKIQPTRNKCEISKASPIYATKAWPKCHTFYTVPFHTSHTCTGVTAPENRNWVSTFSFC